MEEQPTLEILSTQQQHDDTSGVDFSPKSFAQYLGQTAVKEKLTVYTKAALMRGSALDHVLLYGPPGLGKTTLATILAHELGVTIKQTSAPVLERTGDLVALLTNLEENDVLFIDEIHRLSKQVEEILYSAMENFCVDMMVGQGAGAKSIRLPLAPFTLVGATTKTAMISGPLQTRFGIVERLDFYTPEELAHIVQQNSTFLGWDISLEAALTIGKRARGTPRIAKRLLRRVRDFAQVAQEGAADTTISHEQAEEALAFLGVDKHGLNKLDRDILRHIVKDFNGGPVGLDTLAALTGEDKDTLEDFCEPYLLRNGWLQKTPRGRQVPGIKIRAVYALLGLQWTDQTEASDQSSLF